MYADDALCGISVQEATKGYFSDLSRTRKHGGKTWIAPKTLIREDVCSHLSSNTIPLWNLILTGFFPRLEHGFILDLTQHIRVYDCEYERTKIMRALACSVLPGHRGYVAG